MINVNISPIQMQHCIFDHTSSEFVQKLEMCPWDTDAPAIAKFA